jgi:Zn-dependent protease/predicted transcriptional regulator
MTDHALTIGRIHGIELRVHWSWLIIFLLLTWSIATAFFPTFYPGWPVGAYWALGALSSLLLFVSVLLHELAHSLVAQAEGIPVSSITLFVFGGVSNIQREPPSAKDEFLMAFAGPATSLVIGAVSFAIAGAIGGSGPSLTQSEVVGLFTALGYYNLALGIFNLIPGFPLDGGRIFRSIVWAITGNFQESTTIATAAGHLFAYLFIFGGLLLIFLGGFLSGLWLLLIGWFLNNAASASQQQTRLAAALRGVQVQSIMRSPPPDVPANTSVLDFVEHYVLAQNLRALPVVDEGNQLVGLVTLTEARSVPRERWAQTTVAEVMIPANRLKTATLGEPVGTALRDLSENDLNQLPVVDQGQLVGLITRGDVLRYLQVREELQRPAA